MCNGQGVENLLIKRGNGLWIWVSGSTDLREWVYGFGSIGLWVRVKSQGVENLLINIGNETMVRTSGSMG